NLQIEYAMEERMLHVQNNKLALGQDALNLLFEVVPLPFAPEIIGHQHAAVEQIFPEDRHFLIPKQQTAWLDRVNKRIIEKFRIGYAQHAAIRVHFQRSDLLQAEGQI